MKWLIGPIQYINNNNKTETMHRKTEFRSASCQSLEHHCKM